MFWWLSPGNGGSFEPPFRAPLVITWKLEMEQLLKIKEQVSSIWAKGHMSDDCGYVI